ncbi:MAG: hypothetical protein WCC81_17810 [Pseudolabrys sp.]|jgi:hypothetical protein
MAKPIKVEKLQTWMGTTYRVYVHGVYWGAAATRAKALDAEKALEQWDFETMKRKRPKRP